MSRRDLSIAYQAVQSRLFYFSIYLYNMEKELKQQNFIKVSSIIHNNKYDYSLVEFINTKSKVNIICPTHGVFEQTPEYHKNGSGCIKCSYEIRQSSTKMNTAYFIKKAIDIHSGKYDYSLCDYKTTHIDVIISCPIHDTFNQRPSHHLRGSGCPKCGNDVISKKNFINQAKLIHGDFYDYSLVDFVNTKKRIKILCPTHGIFEQIPYHHYNGSGCPICRESKGEREITKYLNENNIKFIRQYRFSDCKDKRSLPFDFYLPDYNTCIEFDGEQHFKSKTQWAGEAGLLDRQKKDFIKNEYCKQKGIKLIRLINIKEINNKKIDLFKIN